MSDHAMPVGKIGTVTISRLMIGSNQFSGWSHSRDLKYLRDLFKAYATEKKILETLHHDQYWSATPKAQRVEFNVDSNGPQDYDNIWSITPEKDIEFMRTVPRSWIAFKTLAAGAIHPRDGFKFAFDNGADFICVGMFDFQVRGNAIIARDTVSRARNRPRPWRA